MFFDIYAQYCRQLRQQNRHRVLPAHDSSIAVNFSTNDYLQLSRHPEVIRHAQAAAADGAGSTGSRLLSGNSDRFCRLETQIARDKGEESALIFNSGYGANCSILAALLNEKVLRQQPLVFCDHAAHASMYEGVLRSKAQWKRFAHNDLNHLRRLLEEFTLDTRPKFILAESVYSMDGDIVPLQELVNLCREFSAFLYLDEAHATGIFGNDGHGFSTTVALDTLPHLIVGTFSKALGCFGAYVSGARLFCDYLLNCPGFIFTTALPPMVLGAVECAWKLLPSLSEERAQLLKNAQLLRQLLADAGFSTGKSNSQIVPVLLDDELAVLTAKDFLRERQMRVSAVRPPTVPPNHCCLRISLTTQHHPSDLIRLQQALVEFRQENPRHCSK